MKLKQIQLHNFRCAAEETIVFSDGVNLLYGKNAQGKTNVLEAVYFFARGKSFRGGKDSDILRFGEQDYSIKMQFESFGEEYVLEYRYYDGTRLRLCNGVKVSAKEQIGKFNAVLFYPDHLSIIKNAPSERREFLNVAISQLSSLYLADLAAHKRLCDQKNALLKQENGIDLSLLASYNEQIAEVSAKICLARRAYVEKLQNSIAVTVREISNGKEQVEILYHSDIPAEKSRLFQVQSEYSRLFSDMQAREIAAGMCLCGIQRDDLTFTVNGKDARQFASQGQQRSIAVALKIGEGEILTAERGEAPVYLFDDVLGELDSDRKAYVLSKTQDRQILVTDCNAALYTALANVNSIFVENGTYQKA